jgi:hypothetical protein
MAGKKHTSRLNFLKLLWSNNRCNKKMRIKPVYSEFIKWLKSTEMFARPAREVPGRWQLFEYYTEPGNELVHVNEDQLKDENLAWEIEFGPGGKFSQKTNREIPFLHAGDVYRWSIAKNYITLLHPSDFRQNEEFQFAIDRGILKLLKKSSTGKIELFGFFKRVEEAS